MIKSSSNNEKVITHFYTYSRDPKTKVDIGVKEYSSNQKISEVKAEIVSDLNDLNRSWEISIKG